MKNRTAFFSGLALFVSFCLLTGAGRIIGALEPVHLLLGMLAAEAGAFLVPLLLVKLGASPEPPVRLRLRPRAGTPAAFGFTIFSGLAIALGVFLLNYLFVHVNANHATSLSSFIYQPNSGVPAILLGAAFLLAAPVFEELFLRGALLSAHEKLTGTGLCILLSGLCFAMLHGSLQNFLGPLLAGCLYAYLTYALDCVWPAVVSHMLNNAFYLGMAWITNTYSAFGIWKYIPGVAAVLLLLFGYLSFCCLENLLIHDSIVKFKRTDKLVPGLFAITCNPGFLVFVCAFLAKTVLGML